MMLLGGLHTACSGWALGITRDLLLQDALKLQLTEDTAGVKEGGAVWTVVLRLLTKLRAAGIACQPWLADGKAAIS
jgi:hypothetical protein